MRSSEHRLLMIMSDQDRVSMAQWIEHQIMSEAKRMGIK